MKFLRMFLYGFMLFSLALLPIGCGCQKKSESHKEESGHGHGKEKSEEGEHGEEESPSGASFKPGKGVILTPETSKILGLEIADVTEEKLAQVIELNVQIFSDAHRFKDLKIDHTGCDFHASGFLPADKAALVKPKQQVKLLDSNNETFEGFVAAVQKPLSHGETEIIVGVTAAESKLKDGEFVQALISVPRDEVVPVIPSAALLRTAEGTYVYAVNGKAYYRTAVKPGSQAGDKLEIIDGLYPGDQVVVKPVETLWLIELRATKGGGHSH